MLSILSTLHFSQLDCQHESNPAGDTTFTCAQSSESAAPSGQVNITLTTTNKNKNLEGHSLVHMPHSSLPPQQQQPQQPLPIRLLLGIASNLNFPVDERQRRHIIRNTYLDFDRLHHPNKPKRVCSLRDFLWQPKQHCQLVYTFLLGPTNGTALLPETYGAVLDPLRYFLDNQHEQDVIYLNVQETDLVGKRWAWFSYANSLLRNQSTLPDIHYAAYTDAHLLIKPSTFWEQNDPIFGPPSSRSINPNPRNDNTTSDQLSAQRIYAGLPTEKSKCIDKKCVSLKGDYVMRRFVMLSNDLVDFVVTNMQQHTRHPLNTTDVPDVFIANVLYTYPHGPIRQVPLQGLVPKTSTTNSIGDYLSAFDKYKDKEVDYRDDNEISLVGNVTGAATNFNHPRLLLGIFTMDSSLEKERRKTIRSTYIQAFQQRGGGGGGGNPNRICSLQQYFQFPKKQRHCQIAYVFVVGGNPNGPKELVEETKESGPVNMESPLESSSDIKDEDDIVFLNIQENGKEGKSQTFFKYATKVLESHYFDYIGKIDSDTLLYPKSFLEQCFDSFPTFPNNMRIYGGDYRIKPSKETLNLGPAYMGGHFYILSPDLARYITSSECNRTALAVFSEDQSIGNFVHSLEKPIRRLRVPTFHYDHPVKRVDRMKTLWRKRQKGKQ